MSTPEVGKTYQVEHQRKGTFRARVVNVSDPWVMVVVLMESVIGFVNTWDDGDTLNIRASLATFEEVADASPVRTPIPVDRWGRDHFTTLLYVMSCVVSNEGKCDASRMRHWSGRPRRGWGNGPTMPFLRDYPTRLAGDEEQADHDDWDCVEDMVAAGMVLWEGTGMHPILKLTDYGWTAARAMAEARNAGVYVSNLTSALIPAFVSPEVR